LRLPRYPGGKPISWSGNPGDGKPLGIRSIDILVNNAGAITPPKDLVEKIDEEWNRDIDLNLKGTINCTKAVLSHMLARKNGKIINISSIGARKGMAHAVVYNAAKAGVVGFTQSLGVELAPSGINVNCIAPGLGFTNFGGGNAPPPSVKGAVDRIPIRRTTAPQDIANMVAFWLRMWPVMFRTDHRCGRRRSIV
jgi:3-oxoacyl-[acyl-carrier protein] reductase